MKKSKVITVTPHSDEMQELSDLETENIPAERIIDKYLSQGWELKIALKSHRTNNALTLIFERED